MVLGPLKGRNVLMGLQKNDALQGYAFVILLYGTQCGLPRWLKR